MAPRLTSSGSEPPTAPADVVTHDGEAQSAVRRAPFATNPQVGARGQRTQQRILEAALQVFGEEGYYRCSIDRIAERAGCSRASFYQYFSGKEDVFHHLSGQVARQLSASSEALDLLRPDLAGWSAIRAWVARHAEIYRRYEPAFRQYPAAAESDETVATGSARWQQRNVARIHSRLVTTTLPPRQLDPVIRLLLECMTRTDDMAGILRSAAPGRVPRGPARRCRHRRHPPLALRPRRGRQRAPAGSAPAARTSTSTRSAARRSGGASRSTSSAGPAARPSTP